MVIKPLDIRTARKLPTLRRLLMGYELGTRAQDLAALESVGIKRIYHWLQKARELRDQGRLYDPQEVDQDD